MKIIYFIIFITIFSSFELKHHNSPREEITDLSFELSETSLVILGTVQDAGSPHIACDKDCCKILFKNPDKNRKVISLGLVDPENNTKYLFEATPDIAEQMKMLKKLGAENSKVDYAFIDATYYDGKEINNRDISEIPHPFIIKNMSLFANLPWKEKNKINFTHFNHTNPALKLNSSQAKQIIINDVFKL